MKTNPAITERDNIITPADLIRKHIANPAHVVTDDELRMVKVGSDLEPYEALESAAGKVLAEPYNARSINKQPVPYSIE
jgi:hypothetical protein